jgi:C_GCAxxG_C_C family probable redox protein
MMGPRHARRRGTRAMAYHSNRSVTERGEAVGYEARVLEGLDAGFNCAESTVSAFAEEVDLPRDVGIRVATAFGGGIAQTSNTCGLVIGGAIVLSWALGRTDPQDTASMERAYQYVARLIQYVETERGSILCPGILGSDLVDEESRRCAIDSGEFTRRCRIAATDIAGVLERLLHEANKGT